jgi:hypothetical protein
MVMLWVFTKTKAPSISLQALRPKKPLMETEERKTFKPIALRFPIGLFLQKLHQIGSWCYLRKAYSSRDACHDEQAYCALAKLQTKSSPKYTS